MPRLSVLLTLTLVLRPAPALAQQPPANTAAIVGQVIDQVDRRPIGGAVVELAYEVAVPGSAQRSGAALRQMTDSLGRFVFRELPAGALTVRARVGGSGFGPSGFFMSGVGSPIASHVAGGFGQRRPGGPLETIQIANGQIIPDLIVGLWRGGALSGTVLDDLGEPIVDSVVGAVRLSSDGRFVDGPTTRTDDLGRYRLSALLPGRYIVFVPQTITAMSAEAADSGLKRMIDLNASKPASEAFIGWPEAIGIRVGGSIVNVLPGSDPTVGGAAPRREGDAVFIFQTTFHPQATTLANASAIELGVSEEKAGVDVSLQPVRTAPVSGAVMDAGVPATGVRLRLSPAGPAPEAALFQAASTVTDALGRFTFPVVPAGNYTIETLIAPPVPPQIPSGAQGTARQGGVGAWLSEPVTVGSEGVSGLVFALKKSFTLKAKIEFDGASVRPTDQQMARFAISLAALRPRGRIDFGGIAAQSPLTPNGEVLLGGITPGRYTLRMAASLPGAPWKLQSVYVGGRDVTDLPFDVSDDIDNVRIVLADRSASVAGRVTFSDPAGGSPAVLLFPADRALWPDARALGRRFRLVRTSVTGDFSIADVPPGDYLVVAVGDEAAGNWPDVSFLNVLLPAADAVRVDAGNRANVSLIVKAVVKR